MRLDPALWFTSIPGRGPPFFFLGESGGQGDGFVQEEGTLGGL